MIRDGFGEFKPYLLFSKIPYCEKKGDLYDIFHEYQNE